MIAGASTSSWPSIEDRRAEVQAALEDELKRIVDAGEYAAWFAKLSSFHRYSPNNGAWILAQAPDATKVASYRTWQQIGRQVHKGETGIMVFHPKPYWVDPATGERVRPPCAGGRPSRARRPPRRLVRRAGRRRRVQ